MSRNERDDTLKVMLDASRRALADVSAALERGKIKTTSTHAIKVVGPWSVGAIFQSDDLAIYLYVAYETKLDAALDQQKFSRRAVYLGKQGKANIYRGTSGYTRISEASLASVDPGEEHSVEPVEAGTQLLVILLGGGEADHVVK